MVVPRVNFTAGHLVSLKIEQNPRARIYPILRYYNMMDYLLLVISSSYLATVLHW